MASTCPLTGLVPYLLDCACNGHEYNSVLDQDDLGQVQGSLRAGSFRRQARVARMDAWLDSG